MKWFFNKSNKKVSEKIISTEAGGVALSTESQCTSVITGFSGTAIATGLGSTSYALGFRSTALNTGPVGKALAMEQESIACGLGVQCKAKGAKGCWLVLAERKIGGEILSVKAEKVDGEKIKENTYYKLVDGKFMEAEK